MSIIPAEARIRKKPQNPVLAKAKIKSDGIKAQRKDEKEILTPHLSQFLV